MEETADEIGERVEEGYERAKQKVEEGFETVRSSIDEKRADAREALDVGKEAVGSAREELEQRLSESRSRRKVVTADEVAE